MLPFRNGWKILTFCSIALKTLPARSEAIWATSWSAVLRWHQEATAALEPQLLCRARGLLGAGRGLRGAETCSGTSLPAVRAQLREDQDMPDPKPKLPSTCCSAASEEDCSFYFPGDVSSDSARTDWQHLLLPCPTPCVTKSPPPHCLSVISPLPKLFVQGTLAAPMNSLVVILLNLSCQSRVVSALLCALGCRRSLAVSLDDLGLAPAKILLCYGTSEHFVRKTFSHSQESAPGGPAWAECSIRRSET